jgi:hypothetical protein
MRRITTPSVNLSQLCDTVRLKAWLCAGKTFELRDRNHIIARIVPEKEEQGPVTWPDFEARRKKIFGLTNDRIVWYRLIVVLQSGDQHGCIGHGYPDHAGCDVAVCDSSSLDTF